MTERLRRKKPASVSEIASYLNRVLRVDAISDRALNGLQVEGRRPVRKVAAAVDASVATFEMAAAAGADLILVHHGLFWGEPAALTGGAYRRAEILLQTGMGLYASHLPLDLHPVMGNNILLARRLGLNRLKPFGRYHGQTIGFGGQYEKFRGLSQVADALGRTVGAPPRVLPLGPKQVRRVAVVSGGGGDMAQEAAAAGYEVLVTGEAGHQEYHPCREAGINLILGGHYATETLGVQSLARHLGEKFDIKTVFLDIPTGL